MSIHIASRPTAMHASPPATRRWANVTLWVLQSVLAAVYVSSALPKLVADPQTAAAFEPIGLGPTGLFVIGLLEIAGAVALLIPRLCGLAGLAFVGLMVGAVIATVAGVGAEMAALPAALLVLVAIVAWARRHRTAELVAAVRRHRR